MVSVSEALERDLKAFPPGAADSALAAAARVLAARLDDPDAAAYAVAAASKELREVLGQLRRQAPPKAQGDKVDDISAAYAKRRRRTGTKG